MSNQNDNDAFEPEVQQHADVIALVRYHVTEKDIVETTAAYAALDANTTAGYEQVRKAIAYCRTTRVEIEERRVQLKAQSLEYGRRVDAGAKTLVALITPIEDDLQAKKALVDEAKARAKREVEEAKKRELEAKVRAEQEAAEAERKARQAAEEARLAEERRQLEAERAELDRQRQELQAAQAKAERDEFERQTKARLEREAAEQAERDRVAAEEARVAEAERQAEHAKRLEALKPDVEKIRAFAHVIGELRAPIVDAVQAQEAVAIAVSALADVVADLELFANQSTSATAAE